MITLKVSKVGNSVGVILPKEALARLHVKQGDTLLLSETPDGYAISSYDPEVAEQMRIAEDVSRKYRNALRALAK